jgi:hypothetical protein
MNRIAEKVIAIMNDEELETLIRANYTNDAQTLTSGAEANLLKFRELNDLLTEEDAQRWKDIKTVFARNTQMQGMGDDEAMAAALLQLAKFSEGLDAIKDTMRTGISKMGGEQAMTKALPHLEKFTEGLDAIKDTMNLGIQTMGKAPAMTKALPHLTKFNKNLDAIKDAMNTGLEKMSDEQATAMAGFNQGLEALKGTVNAGVEKIGTQPPQEVHVVSRVPKTLLAVMKEQFKLMQSWMAPVYHESAMQTKDIKRLESNVDQAMKAYQALINELNPGRKDEIKEKGGK